MLTDEQCPMEYNEQPELRKNGKKITSKYISLLKGQETYGQNRSCQEAN